MRPSTLLHDQQRGVAAADGQEIAAAEEHGVVARGLTILQSNVILDYLARTTGHFEGRTEQERWQAREWLSWEADHITAVARVRHSARFRKMHDEVIAEFRPRRRGGAVVRR